MVDLLISANQTTFTGQGYRKQELTLTVNFVNIINNYILMIYDHSLKRGGGAVGCAITAFLGADREHQELGLDR